MEEICRHKGQRWVVGNVGGPLIGDGIFFLFFLSFLSALSRDRMHDHVSHLYILFHFSFLDLLAPARVTALAASKAIATTTPDGRSLGYWIRF